MWSESVCHGYFYLNNSPSFLVTDPYISIPHLSRFCVVLLMLSVAMSFFSSTNHYNTVQFEFNISWTILYLISKIKFKNGIVHVPLSTISISLLSFYYHF